MALRFTEAARVQVLLFYARKQLDGFPLMALSIFIHVVGTSKLAINLSPSFSNSPSPKIPYGTSGFSFGSFYNPDTVFPNPAVSVLLHRLQSFLIH
jgi:hypothetical protein